jgi:hypothetical protein
MNEWMNGWVDEINGPAEWKELKKQMVNVDARPGARGRLGSTKPFIF